MKLKTLLNLTALALFAIITSSSAHADTHKMYGIQGDKLSIITKVPAPSTYSVKGQTYTTKTEDDAKSYTCLLYTSPSPRDPKTSRMPSSA